MHQTPGADKAWLEHSRLVVVFLLMAAARRPFRRVPFPAMEHEPETALEILARYELACLAEARRRRRLRRRAGGAGVPFGGWCRSRE
jgi:hypothetical protein